MPRKELVEYIEANIIPRYTKFDKAHNQDHVRYVISNSILIAKEYDINKNIVYAAAAYHDLGLELERERHEFFSKEIMLNDKELDEFFDEDERKIISDAILTHRASTKVNPNSIYGKIVADADRDLTPIHIIERTILYSIGHFTEYDKREHFIRCQEHIEEKYGEKGYLKLCLYSESNVKRLKKIRDILSDKNKLEYIFNYYFDKHLG